MNIRYNQTLENPTNCLICFALRCIWHMHLTQYTQMAPTTCARSIARYLPSPLNFQPWNGLSMRLLESPCLRFFVVLYLGLLAHGTNCTSHPQMCFANGVVVGSLVQSPSPHITFVASPCHKSNGRPIHCF
jgi:hypothetical protein